MHHESTGWGARIATVLVALSAAWAGVGIACSGGDNNSGGDLGTGGGAASSGTGGSLIGGGFADSGPDDSGHQDACATSSSEADLTDKPVDIIFAIGNNGSLSQEIAAVEENINVNFAQIIGNSGIDYRVILVSRSGAHQFNICVEAPLGGVPQGQCAQQDNNSAPVNNPPFFFHYSVEVKNNDSWCVLLESFDGTLPDEYGQAPNGWSAWLRPDSAKVFVVLSDSNINCLYQTTDLDDGPQQPNQSNIPEAEQAAADFDAFLLALSPTHFGTTGDRNYIWHSIIGLEPKDPNNAVQPWLPADPLSLVKCTLGASPVSPGLGYQALSRTTEGLRFPVCEWANFDVVFNIIAQGVIDGAAVVCEFPIPDPPQGETIDPDRVIVEYVPGDNSPAETFDQVANAAECGPDKFYIEDELIKLCPEACAKVQADPSAKLNVLFLCETPPPT